MYIRTTTCRNKDGTVVRYLQTTELTEEQRKLLQEMKIELPRRIHHIG
jgi:hypothetical protein